MKTLMRKIALLFVLSCAVLIHIPFKVQAASPEKKPAVYTFGVTPQFEQRKLYAIWNPIIAELRRRTGLTFKMATTLTIEDFDKEYFKGGFDFVYVNPYHVLKTRDYQPLVADSMPLKGVLVVRKDSPVNNLKELAGKEVAFPSPNAFGASLMIRSSLERQYHVKVRPLYVKTHSSVYLHVVNGLVAAGGGVEKTLAEQDPAIRNILRVIYTTPGLTSHPVAAHERVSAADREKVRQALLAMDATPEGRALLAKIPTKQLIPVSMNDYEKMRAWKLDTYWVDMWREDQGK